jgi:hypothetical protein
MCPPVVDGLQTNRVQLDMHECARIAVAMFPDQLDTLKGDASGNNVRLCDLVIRELPGRSDKSLSERRQSLIIQRITGKTP